MAAEDKVQLSPAQELARAMFRAQDEAAISGTFQDQKETWQKHARKTITILENHGYVLTAKED